MRVKTEYGYLEYTRPKSVFQTDRHEAEEIAQVESVLGYLKKFPADHSRDDKELLEWLTKRNVKIIHDRPAQQ